MPNLELEIITFDDFGAQVADCVGRLLPSSSVTVFRQTTPTISPTKGLVVAVMSNPDQALAAGVAAQCLPLDIRLLTITRSGSMVYISPIAPDNQVPCWGCLVFRLQTETPESIAAFSVEAADILLIASSVVAQAQAPSRLARDWFWVVDLENSSVSKTQLLGVGGCHICGSREDWARRGCTRLLSHLNEEVYGDIDVV